MVEAGPKSPCLGITVSLYSWNPDVEPLHKLEKHCEQHQHKILQGESDYTASIELIWVPFITVFSEASYDIVVQQNQIKGVFNLPQLEEESLV